MENFICLSVLNSKNKTFVRGPVTGQKLLDVVNGLNSHDFYLTHNGKKLCDDQVINSGTVHVVPRVYGGKGGFGSMLRAIGAQIEKTTNREACRDLSGRRLRDINEEKRLKTWINQQADREREKAERKRKRLERLVAEPKTEFKDADYETARSEMTEKVADAVEQGFKASQAGSSGAKRPASSKSSAPPAKKKKPGLWLGVDDEELSSSLDTDTDSDADDITGGAKAKPLDFKSKQQAASTSQDEVLDAPEKKFTAVSAV